MHLAFALPPVAETGGGGGADYLNGLTDGLREIGVRVDLLIGSDPVFPCGAIPVIDGMVLPSLHERLDELVRTDAVALIHHIAAAAHDDASRARVHAIQQDMLPHLRRVVTTSAPVADRLRAEFGVTAHVAPPGSRTRIPTTPDPTAPLILAVGVLTRRKGHDRLLRAAARLLDLPWHLVIAGDTRRDPAHVGELRNLAHDLGLAGRVTLLADPEPEALEHAWRHATVFALATAWEGYPTAVAEAVERGIPVVVTSGANAEMVLPQSAGAICPADDMATFGKCLRRLLFDDGLRADMVMATRAAAEALPRWPERAHQFVAFLEQHA